MENKMSTFVKQHASKSAWAGVALSLGTLFVQSYFEHKEKAESQKAIWQSVKQEDNRIATLETRVAILEYIANHRSSP